MSYRICVLVSNYESGNKKNRKSCFTEAKAKSERQIHGQLAWHVHFINNNFSQFISRSGNLNYDRVASVVNTMANIIKKFITCFMLYNHVCVLKPCKNSFVRVGLLIISGNVSYFPYIFKREYSIVFVLFVLFIDIHTPPLSRT